MLRLLALGLVTLTTGGIGGWVCWKPKPADPAAARAAEYADNGPEGAAVRWATNQPTHWRYVVVPRH